MKRRMFFAITLLLSVVLVGQVSAAVRGWEFDKVHSNFYFSVDHIFSKVNGTFDDYSGVVHFDPAHLDQSKMVFDIKVKSINTNNAKRDKHLLSADFFDASNYPTLNFTSNKIHKSAPGMYDVHGTFTVKGKDYKLMLPLQLVGIKDHPMQKGKEVAGFNGKIIIDRLAYNIGTGKFVEYGVVGKDVEIHISIEVLSDKQ